LIQAETLLLTTPWKAELGVAGSIIIFTDGASKGNPGPGGWGAIVGDGRSVTELGGADPRTTNNRMEMEAAIRGIGLALDAAAPIAIYTDSTYLIQGITKWINGWRRKGWKTSQGGEVLNRDLWQRLDELVRGSGAKIEWHYVPGHSGVPGNERADVIASELALGNPVDLYRGAADAYDVDLTPPAANAAMTRPSGRSIGRSKGKSAKAYSYLSLVGGVAQSHRTWAECEKRVHGVSGAKFKKALSAADESQILASWGAASPSR